MTSMRTRLAADRFLSRLRAVAASVFRCDGGGAVPAGDGADRIFGDLASSGRFCRDTRLGSVFRPGRVSFRELRAEGSLHVVLGPGDVVSSHVDRFSPLDLSRSRATCRYALFGWAYHTVIDVARVALGRQGPLRCRLRCDALPVDDHGRDDADDGGGGEREGERDDVRSPGPVVSAAAAVTGGGGGHRLA